MVRVPGAGLAELASLFGPPQGRALPLVEALGVAGLLAASSGVEVPHPIAAGNRLEGRDCQGWRFVPSRSDSEAALDWPVLEGYIIGSG